MAIIASPRRDIPLHRRSSSAPNTFNEINALKQPEQQFYDPESQRISDRIDDELRREQQALREAQRRTVKVMLLGQAESGKSTLQKQFQLYYASHTLDHERPSWKPVVLFNVIKAVRMILDELDYVLSKQEDFSLGDSDSLDNLETAQDEIALLRQKLLPLVAFETSLASELNGGISVSGGRSGVYVRAGWQYILNPTSSRTRTQIERPQVVANMAARTLAALRKEIDDLWQHGAVTRLHKTQKLRLEESAPFFLDNLDRISEPDYIPDTEDILNVRLQTLGVTEHILNVNMGGTIYDWRLYDVGGARGQRPKWVPYFDDATAIIFLAPISAFDQYLEEDLKTNRIDDSLQLFTLICSNPLLKQAHLVLLLNKTDLLRKKLEAGTKVRKYITSYGERPNKYDAVADYFKAHFVQVHKKKDVSPKRTLYVHFTSMLDIKATQKIIVNVGEAIIRQYISQTGLV